MTLREKRIAFSRMVKQLLAYIDEVGEYDYALDFVKRCADCPVGTANSKHKKSLAVDIHLYTKAGNYQGDERGEEAAHNASGAYWESLGGTWGGRFNDANHYQFKE